MSGFVGKNNAKISNRPCGGGDKLQGLQSTTNKRASSIRAIQERSWGQNRNLIFNINQLGGVGRHRSQFVTNADGMNSDHSQGLSVADLNTDPQPLTLKGNITFTWSCDEDCMHSGPDAPRPSCTDVYCPNPGGGAHQCHETLTSISPNGVYFTFAPTDQDNLNTYFGASGPLYMKRLRFLCIAFGPEKTWPEQTPRDLSCNKNIEGYGNHKCLKISNLSRSPQSYLLFTTESAQVYIAPDPTGSRASPTAICLAGAAEEYEPYDAAALTIKDMNINISGKVDNLADWKPVCQGRQPSGQPTVKFTQIGATITIIAA